MPTVFNIKNKPLGTDAVFVGRPSPFGNPFVIGRDGTRAEVIIKFKDYLKTKPELVKLIKLKLKGKDLFCYCKPKACHGDVLLEIANSLF